MSKYLLTNDSVQTNLWKMLETNASYSEDLSTVITVGKSAVDTLFRAEPGTDNSTSGDFNALSSDRLGWRTDSTLTGDFSSGNWTFKVRFESNTKYGFSVKVACRLSRSTSSTGANATEIAISESPNIIDIPASAGGSVTDTWTWSCSGLTLAEEYLFAEYRIKITTAASGAVANCSFACDENPTTADESVETTTFTSSEITRTVSSTGTGSDTLLIEAAFTATDSGSGEDLIPSIGKYSYPLTTDSAVGTDEISKAVSAVIADSETGTDEISTHVSFTTSDSGLGSEILQAGKKFTLTDAGEGIESISKSVEVTISDTSQGLYSELIGHETGVGTDEVSAYTGPTGINVDDGSSIVTEFIGIDKTLTIEDSSLSEEIISIETSFTLDDLGSGIDNISIQIDITLTDSSTEILEEISKSKEFILADSGELKLENITVLGSAAPKQEDSGYSTDEIIVDKIFALSDSGGLEVEEISLDKFITFEDLGECKDKIFIQSFTTVSDSGQSEEVLSFEINILRSDLGTGTDLIIRGKTFISTDSGLGTDAIEVGRAAAPEVSDSGSGIETVNVDALLTLTDDGVGVDVVLVDVRTTITDSGIGIGIVKVDKTFTLTDSAVETDDISVQKTVPKSVEDSSIGSEIIKTSKELAVSDSGGLYEEIISAAKTLCITDTGGLETEEISVYIAIVVYDYTQGFLRYRRVKDTGVGKDIISQFELKVWDEGKGTDRISEKEFIVPEPITVKESEPLISKPQLTISDLGFLKADTIKVIWVGTGITRFVLGDYGGLKKAPAVGEDISLTIDPLVETVDIARYPALIRMTIEDEGYGIDTINTRTLYEQLQGTDEISIEVLITIQDNLTGLEFPREYARVLPDKGEGFDIVFMTYSLNVPDSGFGDDFVQAAQAWDSGTGIETITIVSMITITDSNDIAYEMVRGALTIRAILLVQEFRYLDIATIEKPYFDINTLDKEYLNITSQEKE